jgi:two-component system response regulator FixJ
MTEKAIVHIVDDDDALRDSLQFLLSSAGYATQTYESADRFLEALPKNGRACVITDIRMPGMSGIDLLRELKKVAPSLPVVVITGHGDVPLAVDAMKLGAVDFIEKPFDDVVLLNSVSNALGRIEQDGRKESQRTEIIAKLEQLSARERQVLKGLIAGNANKVIAFDLGISPRTVEIYRANLMTKMEANSLSDLVRMAIVAGVADEAN